MNKMICIICDCPWCCNFKCQIKCDECEGIDIISGCKDFLADDGEITLDDLREDKVFEAHGQKEL
jgi:hypothetical protein